MNRIRYLKVLVALFFGFVIFAGGALSYAVWDDRRDATAEARRLQEERERRAVRVREQMGREATRFVVVEGKRFGHAALGMTIDEIRKNLSLPLTSASDEGEYLWYNWDAQNGEIWSAWFDKATNRAVMIYYLPALAFRDDNLERQYRHRVRFETTRGAKYGHSGETIRVLYGNPSRVVDRESNLGYWYETIRTEFLMVCDLDFKPMSKCPEWARQVQQMRIYADGWEP